MFGRLSSTLKHNKHLQTNQFEVWTRLAGLDERLRIRNNDELANALTIRLETVRSSKIEWLPEILSLFLHLSNDPANKAKVESLAQLNRGTPPPAVTWQDILRDDPLDNIDGIWDVPSYGGSISDESEILIPPALPQKLRSRKEVVEEEKQAFLDVILDHATLESSILDDLASAQFWKKAPEYGERVVITEIQMIRETIFMLLSLPTSLFRYNNVGTAKPTSAYALANTSFEALDKILSAFAQIGTQLFAIRKATQMPHHVPFAQTFQSSLGLELKAVEMALSDIEASIISPTAHESISLIQILQQVRSVARPLLQTRAVATTVLDHSHTPFAVLEALYDLILQMQSVDNSRPYDLALDLFLASLTTYLKPISAWMESGHLDSDSDTFFITKIDKEVSPSQLWTKQYELIYFTDGTLRAPRFLHIAAKKIFNTGKSIVMLKHLGQYPHGSSMPSKVSFAALLRKSLAAGYLCPFGENFTATLNTWIASHYHSHSSILRIAFETSCGLWRSIDAIEHIYFCRNGHVSSHVASLIFARLDARKERVWHDRFILTEIYREAFTPVTSVDVQRLTANPASSAGSNVQSSRSVKELAKVGLVYTLPWSVSNVIKPSSLNVLQSIHILLLQISRSRYLLQHVYHSFSASRSRALHERPLRVLSLSLHHRFLWFLDTLYGHLTDTVLLQASATLRGRMAAAEDVDQMIDVYESFVQLVGEECFVHESRAGTKKAILSILDLVVLFESVCTANEAASMHPRSKGRRQSAGFSESDRSDSDADAPIHTMPHRRNAAADISQLTNISGTYNKLLHFIFASLGQVQSGADGTGQYSQALLDHLSLGIKRE